MLELSDGYPLTGLLTIRGREGAEMGWAQVSLSLQPQQSFKFPLVASTYQGPWLWAEGAPLGWILTYSLVEGQEALVEEGGLIFRGGGRTEGQLQTAP